MARTTPSWTKLGPNLWRAMVRVGPRKVDRRYAFVSNLGTRAAPSFDCYMSHFPSGGPYRSIVLQDEPATLAEAKQAALRRAMNFDLPTLNLPTRTNPTRRKNFLPAVARGAAYVAASPKLRSAAIAGGKYAMAAGKRAVQLALPLAVEVGARMATDAINYARKHVSSGARRNPAMTISYVVRVLRDGKAIRTKPVAEYSAAAKLFDQYVRLYREATPPGEKIEIALVGRYKNDPNGPSNDYTTTISRAKFDTRHWIRRLLRPNPPRQNHHLRPGDIATYQVPGHKAARVTVVRRVPGSHDNYDVKLGGTVLSGIAGQYLKIGMPVRQNSRMLGKTLPVNALVRYIMTLPQNIVKAQIDEAYPDLLLTDSQIENLRNVKTFAFGPGGHGVAWAQEQVRRILTGKRLLKWVTSKSHRY